MVWYGTYIYKYTPQYNSPFNSGCSIILPSKNWPFHDVNSILKYSERQMAINLHFANIAEPNCQCYARFSCLLSLFTGRRDREWGGRVLGRLLRQWPLDIRDGGGDFVSDTSRALLPESSHPGGKQNWYCSEESYFFGRYVV